MRSIAEYLGFCDGKRWGSKGWSGHSRSPDCSEGHGTGSSPGLGQQSSDPATPICLPRCVRPMDKEDLERCMQWASEQVKPWETGSFRLVGKLQDAVRNKGQVDQMQWRGPDGERQVAVKRMPTGWVTRGPKEFQEQYPTAPERPWCDIAIVGELNRLGFPFVCESLGVFRDQEYTYVVASLATRGDLFSWCDLDPLPGQAREEKMRPLATQIFAAIRWLHEVGIAHRDLSLENILLTDSGGETQVKIIDFGMCTASRTVGNEVRGKQSYQAPEMHSAETYDAFLVDTFALGVTLFAMAAQDYPWTSTKRNACQLHEYVCMFGFRKFLEKRKLRKGRGEHLVDVLSPALVDLLEGMLQKSPRSRMSLGESCYSYEATGTERGSVWETKWMASAMPTIEQTAAQ